jgi:hypothetical protein
MKHHDLLAAVWLHGAEPGEVPLCHGGAAGGAVVAVEDDHGGAGVEYLSVVFCISYHNL